MALDVDRVRDIADRVARSSGLEVVEVELSGGGKSRVLRVFLDKPGAGPEPLSGVTHEDCASFSREFGTILDVEDAMASAPYTLEVSSPGLDRKLTRAVDFERFAGSLVKLTTREPVGGNKHFEGRLEAFSDGKLTLDLSAGSRKARRKLGAVAEQNVKIELANVEKANLVPEI
jgi:ribosome maturation factor RimP